ncbi:methyl-accepting chemotaxis protein [Pseudomonas protegens]|uniref:methyl-accepting chemotaxis protein n=1 Tax=Pseudomonas protegens TaxID=380021 RepID=UPI001A924137|nr:MULTISPECIES: methyl-accepting chemotaxis protein [Pseudomonas]MDP4573350.1 methyl-accepting chemotaxis protein [Pseudomonas sp. LPH60]BCT34470.1 methyl-accepting chemotaxis protein [Pseudomonas protegens]
MNYFSIRARLIVLIVLMLVGSLAIGVSGLLGVEGVLGRLNSVYLDRVVPLRDLKQVADLYAVNIVDSSHKARNGSLSFKEARQQVEEAEQQIADIWKAYKATLLIDEEVRLIERIEPLMVQAKQPLQKLKTLLGSEDKAGLALFTAQELYPVIDPLSEDFNQLIAVQLQESSRSYEQGKRVYENNVLFTWGLLLILLCGGGGFAWLLSRSITQRLDGLQKTVARTASGDLREPVKVAGRDEISQVQLSLQSMQNTLRDTLQAIQASATQLHKQAQGLRVTATSNKQGISQQNQEIELAAKAVNQMSLAVDQVARNANLTFDSTRDAQREARSGREQVGQTCLTIEQLGQRLQTTSGTITRLADEVLSISRVLEVIRAIAEQINLLALNAAIEAARAGEQGRGFAVVADEVRALAQRTQSSTAEIEGMITSVQATSREAVQAMVANNEYVERSNAKALEADGVLAQIAERIVQINEMNQAIASTAEQQAQVSREVDQNLLAIRDVAAHNVDSAAQTSSVSDQLASLAGDLHGQVQRFQL